VLFLPQTRSTRSTTSTSCDKHQSNRAQTILVSELTARLTESTCGPASSVRSATFWTMLPFTEKLIAHAENDKDNSVCHNGLSASTSSNYSASPISMCPAHVGAIDRGTHQPGRSGRRRDRRLLRHEDVRVDASGRSPHKGKRQFRRDRNNGRVRSDRDICRGGGAGKAAQPPVEVRLEMLMVRPSETGVERAPHQHGKSRRRIRECQRRVEYVVICDEWTPRRSTARQTSVGIPSTTIDSTFTYNRSHVSIPEVGLYAEGLAKWSCCKNQSCRSFRYSYLGVRRISNSALGTQTNSLEEISNAIPRFTFAALCQVIDALNYDDDGLFPRASDL
jgi:hypothetical protein